MCKKLLLLYFLVLFLCFVTKHRPPLVVFPRVPRFLSLLSSKNSLGCCGRFLNVTKFKRRALAVKPRRGTMDLKWRE